MSGKYALIIGNTEYIDPGLAQLTAPGKDAEDFARVLKDKEIGAFDDVKVIVNEPSASVIEAIDEFFDQKKPDDMLVLYFSGHGIKDEIGSLYLTFKNTIRSRLRSTAIKSDYIKEAMDQSRSKRQVLILDCCNSGAFPQGTKAELGGAMGMTKTFQGYGRFVLTASDATQFAWEGDKVIGETDNSLFTHFLVKGLEGDADSDGDGKITVDELYDYAYDQVSRVTPKQTPTKSSSKVEGEIVLRQSTRIENIKPVALPDDLISEIEDLRPYVREIAAQKLEKILKGKNIGLARSAREALERMQKEDDSRRVSQLATQILEPIRQAEKAAEERKAEEERLALEKAEAERKAKEEVERLLTEQKAEEERKAREEAERLAAQKAEEERLAREKVEAERKAKEESEKIARAQAEREASEREVAEKAVKEKAEKERITSEKRRADEKDEAERKAEEVIQLATKKKAPRPKTVHKTTSEATQNIAENITYAGTKRRASNLNNERDKIIYVIVDDGTPLYKSLPASNNWSVWLEKGSKLSIIAPEEAWESIGKSGHYIEVTDNQGNNGFVTATVVNSKQPSGQKVYEKNHTKTEVEQSATRETENLKTASDKIPFFLSWTSRMVLGGILGTILSLIYSTMVGYLNSGTFTLVFTCSLAGLIIYQHKLSLVFLLLGFFIIGLWGYAYYPARVIIFGGVFGIPAGALISRILYWAKVIK